METIRPRVSEIVAVPPIVRLLRPFQNFLENNGAGGILLLSCTAVALIWANSPWAAAYAALWHTPFTIGPGEAAISKSVLLWVNDGLMPIFFFVVGLEIKRELASPRQAALPIAAAVDGIVAPACLFLLLNAGGPGAAGWGIPMATDIAFALGVLALLGTRVPLAEASLLASAKVGILFVSTIAGIAGYLLLASNSRPAPVRRHV